VKVLSYDALSSNVSVAWAAIESGVEEVEIKRNRRRVASILPEPSALTALEIFGGLHGVLGEAVGSVLARKMSAVREAKRRRSTLHELRESAKAVAFGHEHAR
jgi:hypothetical protein